MISNRAQDRRLRIQLFTDESKKAVAELYRLVNDHEKASAVWSKNIRDSMNSFEGRAFLPPEVRAWAFEKLQSFSNKTDAIYPEFALKNSIRLNKRKNSTSLR